ncbi:arrestin domain-containing protein [Histoplasma capsulatum G186AR]|uniref:Arrestin domain-containing protein n=1 Tax=Ajellomyces capsulatus (strain G186AR / H82 / ATCC MYA-2454 / RMSCC 2432) TaxID=447093 RepID=C0NJ31_AJECG|nr:arrestin domain-containing protein [Histoplasma capsulatum G186AR]EEH07872.1 arrestin domain-containing protein [Histoplasma capsulatum G186AR]
MLMPREALLVGSATSVSSGSHAGSSTPSSTSLSRRPSSVECCGYAHGRKSDESLSALSLFGHEKVVASANGIAVSICLAEPVLFLEGFDRDNADTTKTSILRGTLRLKLSKPAKIKKICLNFKGMGQTNWPEGVPPKKNQFHENHAILNHTWMLFNAQLPDAEYSHGADHIRLKVAAVSTKELAASTIELLALSASNLSRAKQTRDVKKLSLQSNCSRSFAKGEFPRHGEPSVSARGFKLFEPAIIGTISSSLSPHEASVERSGAFRPNLLGHREVPFIRTPPEGSLEHVEPIAISRTWEDQLHYDIVISGKSFPLGGQVPIAFKLTPLAKVSLHRIKVIVTENTQVVANNRTYHRVDGSKKVLLFEKRADSQSTSAFPGSVCRVTAGGGVAYDARREAAEGIEYVNPRNTNLLGDLEESFEVGPTEMEFNVQLPTCTELKKRDPIRSLHFDTTHEQLQIHHWIKIVLRLSRTDERDPSKRRHFEISIDSPFHIMSCLATQSNIYPPAPAFRFHTSAVNTTAHHAPRPIHLLRVPSFAPPSPPAPSSTPPPPLPTPPPDYTTIVPDDDPRAGLHDYFLRLTVAEREYEEGMRGRSHVDVPLTPGGRVHRSMDIPRERVVDEVWGGNAAGGRGNGKV